MRAHKFISPLMTSRYRGAGLEGVYYYVYLPCELDVYTCACSRNSLRDPVHAVLLTLVQLEV